MPGADPNWAEQVTAIATSVGALGLLGAIGAAIFAGQQVREARKSRPAQMAAEFFRRWNDDALVEARRLIARFSDREELSTAFQGYVAARAPGSSTSSSSWPLWSSGASSTSSSSGSSWDLRSSIGGRCGSRRCGRPPRRWRLPAVRGPSLEDAQGAGGGAEMIVA